MVNHSQGVDAKGACESILYLSERSYGKLGDVILLFPVT